MNTSKISSQIHYIGVNDRTTHLFEGLWPLPDGVSYNSYLVVGSDKIAIIDGVEISHALQHIDTITKLLGDRHPDYLIINHMEPDHSGGIQLLRQAYPEITVVGNSITHNMVRGYYGDSHKTLTVRDGDTLSLGPGTTLRFAATPMVHWPETMVTYLEEEHTLFSGDAFGCFGALNGAVVDTEMDADRYFPEMVRYYSNIVGRYGDFVQRAIRKLDGLTVDTICPTHGPVWRSRVAEVIDLYDRMSRYEPLDNGVTIIYGSMYGHTERMAEEAASALASEGVRNISILNVGTTDMSRIIAEIFTHRGLIIASPTYSDGIFPPMAAVIDALVTRKIRNRSVALIGACSWSQQAIGGIADRLASIDVTPIAEPVAFRHSPACDAIAQCRATAAALARTLD
ncbi:MAG: FprA family A-type flavoprotein [Muribaculaceae bacterium]|nr:FprA family A-type flavoprotein [Muribaculaceae bacterium]